MKLQRNYLQTTFVPQKVYIQVVLSFLLKILSTSAAYLSWNKLPDVQPPAYSFLLNKLRVQGSNERSGQFSNQEKTFSREVSNIKFNAFTSVRTLNSVALCSLQKWKYVGKLSPEMEKFRFVLHSFPRWILRYIGHWMPQ